MSEYGRILLTLAECCLMKTAQGKVPEEGLQPHVVHEFISRLASMDSNNRFDMIKVGAGEREGRVVSHTVNQLHIGLAHGIGRSGNLFEKQPKASGSTILGDLANRLVLDAIKNLGITCANYALIVPVATGMALMLCLNAWRRLKPLAKFVVFLRIDQRSCFKAIIAAGFEPIVIDCIKHQKDECLTTDVKKLQNILEARGTEILAVMSTTSCFAPRSPDCIVNVGQLCKAYSVKHLVNNAYDAVVQSLDKNFLVPVGGAVIVTFVKDDIASISNVYAGRASIVPSRDLLITVLELGRMGLQRLYSVQEKNFIVLRDHLSEFAASIDERIFDVPDNLISLAMTLSKWTKEQQFELGSALFKRGVTGARVILSGMNKCVDGYSFENYGSHSSLTHCGYLNVACAIGKFESDLRM
ncbi:unnamed protein product [Dracunculus medinensis]|uniref:O-phosphoseryl-tRNA(Sec) selenium transferase n=1 Tax=Dracunculus medinensis TaxID=318479 RepID=A0A0N4U935_DRAME|nr:unnamed protein product [Dracunculus medinensis]